MEAACPLIACQGSLVCKQLLIYGQPVNSCGARHVPPACQLVQSGYWSLESKGAAEPSELPKHFKGLQVIYLPLTLPMLRLS
uniref:Uncharacterized protein n=1 Tax=Knipowitschia caucasica TaxID=637954 RepID=A0AAV2JIF2_KNICA